MRMTSDDEADDETLARRAAGGDREAFAALVERHYDRIHRIGLRLLGEPAEAEDLAQDVCIALARRIRSFRGDSRFTTWLYRVVVNAARDAHRRRVAARRADETAADLAPLVAAGHAARCAEIAWLHEALAALSEDLRATAVLVLSEELSHAEAGAALGVKESTVSWRMHEVRKQLRKLAEAGEALTI